ncbi:MAG: hypothetical protein CMM46_00640 [Rhodospirillaceae bacterium]|nr:hypothetical protein [Rhodospirillaceae bacterium]
MVRIRPDTQHEEGSLVPIRVVERETTFDQMRHGGLIIIEQDRKIGAGQHDSEVVCLRDTARQTPLQPNLEIGVKIGELIPDRLSRTIINNDDLEVVSGS